MELWINKDKVSAVLQVAIGYGDKEFEIFIREAQDFDLKPLLCEEFYFDLNKERVDGAAWQKLIEGGQYQYEEKSFFFRGISDVLSYFTYARYVLKSPYVATSHGIVQKTTPHSETVSLEERRSLYYKYRKEANTILEDCKKFIERNISDYPSWKVGIGWSPKGNTNFKTTVIQ